jgi:hypothetical protein
VFWVEGVLEFGVELWVPELPEGLELCANANAEMPTAQIKSIPENILLFLMTISITLFEV